MSHVDDGTLHAYLDGELSPPEAQGVEAHLAQCPGCRGRLEEERALITRAGELLALAAPPDRELPPFRAGDAKPPTRLWWQVRLGLAWAATVAIALGIGTYLGRGVEQVPQTPTASDSQPAELHALLTPLSADTARRESRVLAQREYRAKPRGAARTPPAAQPAAPAGAFVDGVAPVARAEQAAESEARVAQRRAPQNARDLWQKGSAISLDSARRVLDADPVIVPGVPIEAIYRGRHIGYSGVVIVEQALDSSTMIEVINARAAPVALEAVVVTGAQAGAATPDSLTVSERAQAGRSRRADSLAALPRDAALGRAPQPTANRTGADLFRDVRGPLSADSLAALRRLLQPLRP